MIVINFHLNLRWFLSSNERLILIYICANSIKLGSNGSISILHANHFLCHAHFEIRSYWQRFLFPGYNIFLLDGKKYEDICPSTHNMECPIVKRTEYQLIDIDDEGFCSLMDDTGETRDDLKPLEPELEKQIREKVDAGEDALVCVLKVCFISNIPKRP